MAAKRLDSIHGNSLYRVTNYDPFVDIPMYPLSNERGQETTTCVKRGQWTETITDQWSSLQKPPMGVTSCTACRSWEQPPLIQVREPPGRPGMALVHAARLPAPWKPICSSKPQANLTAFTTFPITPPS